MNLIIISGLYIAILITVIAIWKKNWNRFRKELVAEKRLKTVALESRDDYKKRLQAQIQLIESKNETIDKLWTQIEKLEHLWLDTQVVFDDQEVRYKNKLDEYTRNAQLKIWLLEDQIEENEEYVGGIRAKLKAEQVDSNNKEKAREKWRAKFEALMHIVESENIWNHMIKKYKHNWKKIIEAYNKNKK